MNETTTFPAPVVLPGPLRTKWQREYQAFLRLLPYLLTTYGGRFVAIHDGQVVDSGDDKLALARRVFAKVGNVDIHVGLVTDEPEAVCRSGVRRDLAVGGGVGACPSSPP